MNLRRIISMHVLVGAVGAWSGAAQAFWEFPSERAYTRSVNLTGTADGDPNHSFNYYGTGDPHVTQTSTGTYLVEFPGAHQFDTNGGNVQVTAFGTTNTRCKVGGWGASENTMQITVHCFSATEGILADSLFTVSYVQRWDSPYPFPEAAYVWAWDPSSPSYDLTDSWWTWSSTNQPVTITHVPGSGLYEVLLAGQNGGTAWPVPSPGTCWDDKAGTIEITAYGGDNTYCKAQQPPQNRLNNAQLPNDTKIYVACFDGRTGVSKDSLFSLAFSTISVEASQSGGYVYAYNAVRTTDYVPSASWQKYTRQFVNTGDGNACPHCFFSDHPTISHPSVGNYQVRFGILGGSGLYSHVNVVAVSGSAESCRVSDWQEDSVNLTVSVQCRRATGALTDGNFNVNVMTDEFLWSF
jgi:hypothetical protein